MTEEQRNEKVTDRGTEKWKGDRGGRKKIRKSVDNNSERTETHTISICANAKRGLENR